MPYLYSEDIVDCDINVENVLDTTERIVEVADLMLACHFNGIGSVTSFRVSRLETSANCCSEYVTRFKYGKPVYTFRCEVFFNIALSGRCISVVTNLRNFSPKFQRKVVFFQSRQEQVSWAAQDC